MNDVQPPLLVVISGLPATGKTTLGLRLAADLALPFFSKDILKETLFDSLGVADRTWSRRLGVAAFGLLRSITESMLSARTSLMLEANFLAEFDAPFYQSVSQRFGARVAQVWMTATPEVIADRFERRASSLERHPGHVESLYLDEFLPRLLNAQDAPLPLEGSLIIVDTTDFDTLAYEPVLLALQSVKDGAELAFRTS